jgi:hypothetical protein
MGLFNQYTVRIGIIIKISLLKESAAFKIYSQEHVLCVCVKNITPFANFVPLVAKSALII